MAEIGRRGRDPTGAGGEDIYPLRSPVQTGSEIRPGGVRSIFVYLE